MLTHGLVITALVADAVVVVGTSTKLVDRSTQSVANAVALYARGELAAAVDALDRRLTIDRFTSGLEYWIDSADMASARHRRRVGVAFALDAVWGATRQLHNTSDFVRDLKGDPVRETLTSPASQGLVATWVARQLGSTDTADSLDRTLWLLTIGIAEDGCAWEALLHAVLPIARKRLTDEPRLMLAEALAWSNHNLGPLRKEQPPGLGILRVERLPSSATRRIPEAIRAFEPLLRVSSVAGEAELRLGYLELRRGRWPEALSRFGAAVEKTGDPVLVAAAHYFSGWVLEQQRRPDDALAAYQKSYAITPLMFNLATRLSALLFLRNERAEAYLILDRAVKARPAPQDLLLTLERGDARFVPEWLASIRGALQ